jgi:hypothetical protein
MDTIVFDIDEIVGEQLSECSDIVALQGVDNLVFARHDLLQHGLIVLRRSLMLVGCETGRKSSYETSGHETYGERCFHDLAPQYGLF